MKENEVTLLKNYKEIETSDFDVMVIIGQKAKDSKSLLELRKTIEKFSKKIVFISLNEETTFKNIMCEPQEKIKLNLITSIHIETAKRINTSKNKNIEIEECGFIPINNWPLFTTKESIKNISQVDFIKFVRHPSLLKEESYEQYLGENIKMSLFGNYEDITMPNIEKIFNNFTIANLIKEYSKGFATVFVEADRNRTTVELACALLANCVIFVDDKLDKNRRLYPKVEFLYVRDYKELYNKIQLLKKDETLYKQVMKIQMDLIKKIKKYDIKKTLNNFMSKIGGKK